MYNDSPDYISNQPKPLSPLIFLKAKKNVKPRLDFSFL